MQGCEPKYYSQYGEDFLLWRLFGHKVDGFYVDVGAFDGVFLSNTFSFEQCGWSGICVEPHPKYFPLCKQARPRAVCLNVACVSSDDVHAVGFYVEELGILSGIQAGPEDNVRARYQKRGLDFKGFEKLTVPALTLNAILNDHLPPGVEIDLLSIDVEGTELQVLQGLDLRRFRPRVIVIEANFKEAGKILDAYLKKFGYIRAGKLFINAFYVQDLRDAEKLQAIPIDCEIERSLHPMGEEYTLPDEGSLIRGRKLTWRRRPKKKRIREWVRRKLLMLLGAK
jgi:FkbM family methyltransferase